MSGIPIRQVAAMRGNNSTLNHTSEVGKSERGFARMLPQTQQQGHGHGFGVNNFNLDPSQAAKQMALLTAAQNARIGGNPRPYLGGNQPPNHDLLSSGGCPGSTCPTSDTEYC
ncbi:hypothetical protein CC2G_000986 [Coprinopsis cinerea AmutBmut pab1-1]|nr:hypothetical protein CC2G_000986 [Coprinopsis cinerea AmutBmut pab1-1]